MIAAGQLRAQRPGAVQCSQLLFAPPVPRLSAAELLGWAALLLDEGHPAMGDRLVVTCDRALGTG
jgi:hypothetical protein